MNARHAASDEKKRGIGYHVPPMSLQGTQEPFVCSTAFMTFIMTAAVRTSRTKLTLSETIFGPTSF